MAANNFALSLTKEAFLLTDGEKILAVNRAFEDLSEYTALSITGASVTNIFSTDYEKKAFYSAVQSLFADMSSHGTTEVRAECQAQYSGMFLCRVVFYAFVDQDDSKKKCWCIFSDPLFYHTTMSLNPALPNTSRLIFEFIHEERDCVVRRANTSAAERFKIALDQMEGKFVMRDLHVPFDTEDFCFFNGLGKKDTRVFEKHVPNPEGSKEDKRMMLGTLSFLGNSIYFYILLNYLFIYFIYKFGHQSKVVAIRSSGWLFTSND